MRRGRESSRFRVSSGWAAVATGVLIHPPATTHHGLQERNDVPVIGHAFAGWATAELTRAAERTGQVETHHGWRTAAVIALAYAPDVVSQLAAAVGRRYFGFLSHSIGFALAAAVVVGGVTWWFRGSWRQAFWLCLFSVLLHDAMDFTQSGDRWYAWPFYYGDLGPRRPVIPRGLVSEVVFFGLPSLALVVARRGWTPLLPRWPARGWRRLQGPVIAAAIIGVATGVDYVRDLREDQLDEASTLIAARRFDEAFATLDRASRWPFPARRSRVDYARAEAFAAMGDRERAEQLYLSVYERDPGYFWVVADLAAFYASADLPREERARRAQPFIDRLRRNFANEPSLAIVLQRVQRLLDAAD